MDFFDGVWEIEDESLDNAIKQSKGPSDTRRVRY